MADYHSWSGRWKDCRDTWDLSRHLNKCDFCIMMDCVFPLESGVEYVLSYSVKIPEVSH